MKNIRALKDCSKEPGMIAMAITHVVNWKLAQFCPVFIAFLLVMNSYYSGYRTHLPIRKAELLVELLNVCSGALAMFIACCTRQELLLRERWVLRMESFIKIMGTGSSTKDEHLE